MADNSTTIRRSVRESWLDGYQRAVEAMRDWAEEFGDEQTKRAVLTCADMVEAAKPTKEKTTIGSYVTAKLVGHEGCRQGVHIGFTTSGYAIIQGETQLEPYICDPDVAVVPDRNIIFDSTRRHVAEIRQRMKEIP